MKNSRHYNLNRRKPPSRKKSPYSKEYIDERKEELLKLLAETKTDAEREALIKAFDVTINP